MGKVPNEKDNERGTQIPPSMLRYLRNGRWILNSSGRRNSSLVEFHIRSDFKVLNKPTLRKDLEK